MLGEKDNAIAIQHICLTLLSIRSLEFEGVSDTHELNAVLCQLSLKPTSIVTGFRIVWFIIDSSHHVSRREPPAVVLVIPDRPHLAIIEKPYRLLTHIRRFLLCTLVRATLKQFRHLVGSKSHRFIGKPNLNLRLASLRLK